MTETPLDPVLDTLASTAIGESVDKRQKLTGNSAFTFIVFEICAYAR